MLENSLAKGTLAHAYLIVGPAHVGKKTLALNLAQALNCESDSAPCGECAQCRKIASLKHADVQIIGLDQNGDLKQSQQVEISIDQIRELEHSSNLPPFEGKYKVFIIDDAQLMSNEAANCLLKTLEEPVGKVVFLLLTTSEGLLPETVVSRCQRLELLPLPVGEVEEILKGNWGVEPEKANILSRLSCGCLGWAVLASGDESLLEERNQLIQRLLGITGADYEERFGYAGELAAGFGKNRRLVLDVLELWLGFWRDLLLTKLGFTSGITNIDFETELGRMSSSYTLAQIRDFIDAIRTASKELELNANPQLVLEVWMLDLPRKGEKVGAAAPDFE